MLQLECRDLTIGYEGKTVISGLSFMVNAGDYLCIVGENGSGKTSLMKTILRLKAPMSGQIVTTGGLAPNNIGYLPQQTETQKDFPASVREVVRSGCLNRCGFRPFFNTEEKRIAEQNMERLGLTSISKHCYRELSGGQQRRALLARALCATSKILLLDEPAAGLDPKVSADMYEIIAELNHKGTTIIMITHDITASIKYATHILHISNQSSLFFGTADEYARSGAGRIFAGMEDVRV